MISNVWITGLYMQMYTSQIACYLHENVVTSLKKTVDPTDFISVNG